MHKTCKIKCLILNAQNHTEHFLKKIFFLMCKTYGQTKVRPTEVHMPTVVLDVNSVKSVEIMSVNRLVKVSPECWQTGLGLFDVLEIGLPQVYAEDLHQTSLE